MKNIPEIFNSKVFCDAKMKEYLPNDIYESLKETVSSGKKLDPSIADAVADGMCKWAVANGATHFTHWFQPLTGTTAEKHESFISPDKNGGIIMKFSGKELISGEADASSFPSGGLRATFEARGYSAWDPTSFAFIKDNTLCIPTAFCSYNGESLDKKTPLLRSMEAIDREAVRILRLFGDNETRHVVSEAGAEQEYFLIDREMYEKRPDLVLCGRTLFGARPPKGQEMDDHYYGQIKPRVSEFMKELDEELWALGVLAKTEHNEVAPSQHELAPIYSTVNIATDHNQLTMELMKKIAKKHGLVCLIHEKPFAGVNGSGKHDNWSISTDTGRNLLKPGKTPSQNAQFLLFLSAVIKAVDENQDLLRISVSSAGNDHRLGAGEAPPAIISMFLGDDLTAVLEDIMGGETHSDSQKTKMNIGVSVLPDFNRDTTDRNRTSPFAFTGNKFEFRMPGSAFSIACPNMIINTIVASALSDFADILEKSKDFESDLNSLIRTTLIKHKRIIFNGNNYSEEWVNEAAKRGLTNFRNTVEALPHYSDEKNVKLFEKFKVLTRSEIESRQEVLLENYSKTIHIEALTLIDLVKKDIIPAVISFEQSVLEVDKNKTYLMQDKKDSFEKKIIKHISSVTDNLYDKIEELETLIMKAKTLTDTVETAVFYREKVFNSMAEIRMNVDELETTVGRKYWPFPTYADILNSTDSEKH